MKKLLGCLLAATALAAPAAAHATDPTSPPIAFITSDDANAAVGSYATVCTTDHVDTLPNQCVSAPAPAGVYYYDRVYCSAKGQQYIDSDGNQWWEWTTTGYIQTSDKRATQMEVTCEVPETYDSISATGPAPKVTVGPGTLVTDTKQDHLCAYGWIDYKYNGGIQRRYVGDPCP